MTTVDVARPQVTGGRRHSARLRYEFVLVTALLLIAWEVYPRITETSHVVLPTFSRVMATLLEEFPAWLPELRTTLVELVVAFGTGASAGCLLGIAIYYSAFLQRGVYPLVTVIRIVPKVALTPLFLVWFGIGMGSKVALAFVGIAFMMLVQTITGLKAIDPAMIELGRSVKMNEPQILWRMRLPSALPALLVGVKLSLVYALTMIILAEMIVASAGLGSILVLSKARLQTDSIMALVLLIAVMGLILFAFGNMIERRATRWHIDQE